MPSTDTTFRDMIRLIDEDFKVVQASKFKRESLYYTVKIDGRETNILGRKARVPDNNARKFSFLIRTPQGSLTHTTLYLSEIDIIIILSSLDGISYKHIRDHLVRVYREETDPSEYSVQLHRAALVPDVEGKTLVANHSVLAMPIPNNNPNIATSFGFTISFQSFCDALSLILSTDNEQKLKIIVTKYCIFAALLRTRSPRESIPVLLTGVGTVKDVEEIYAGMRPLDVQLYDRATFTPQIQTDFFGSV